MNRHGLRTRIILFSILPLLIIGSGLFAFFTLKNYSQINNTLIQQSKMVIYPLSTNISFAMTQKKLPILQGLINDAHHANSRNILAISVFDKNNKMLATSSVIPEISLFKLDKRNNDYIYPHESVEYVNDGIIMRMPIYVHDDSNVLSLYNTNFSTANNETSNNSQTLTEFQDPKLDYPRQVVGYVCIYFLRNQTVTEIYGDISVASVLFVFGLLISLIFGFNLNKIIIDPINKISTAIYEIREGNVDTKVHGVMLGELERLRTYINSMANTMADSHNEMQYSVDLATNDLRNTLQKLSHQNKELELANDRAVEASQIKSQFLANMSHELRTPLNGILGFTKQLNKSSLNSDQLEYLGTIERSAVNLLSIVNNILDFSKLETGKMVFEKIPFSFRGICYDTVKILSPNAYEKGLELTITIKKDVHDYIIGDPIRIQQILVNLIGNALKFTQQGNVALEISVDTKTNTGPHKTNIKCSVKDTGIGITPEQKEALFTPFTQADASISRKYGGTGLGLVITRHLIEQMGGKIELKSELGEGSEFTFNLVLNKGISPLNGRDLRLNKVKNQKIALIESNTWVRDSIKNMLDIWQMEVITMSSITPFNSISRKDQPKFLIIGLKHDFDFSQFYNEFSTIDTDKLDKIIVAVNTLNTDVINSIRDINNKIVVMTKPIEPQKLLNNLTDSSNIDEKENNSAKKDNTIKQIVPPSFASKQTPIKTNEFKSSTYQKKNNLIRASILAVDDNTTNIMLIKTLLSEIVSDVTTASNGKEAVKMCLNTEFDLIFMDIQMPIMDGLTASQLIKQNDTNKNTPIIAVTALVMEEEKRKLYEIGMSDYLSKPIDDVKLKELINKYCIDNSNVDLINYNQATQNNTLSTPLDASILDSDQTLWSKEQALRMSANKPDLAINLLKDFIKSVPEVLEKLTHKDTIQPLELAKIIHKFAGGAAYCGLNNIKTLCNTIEINIKENNNIDDVEPELLELEDKINLILNNHETWINELSSLLKD